MARVAPSFDGRALIEIRFPRRCHGPPGRRNFPLGCPGRHPVRPNPSCDRAGGGRRPGDVELLGILRGSGLRRNLRLLHPLRGAGVRDRLAVERQRASGNPPTAGDPPSVFGFSALLFSFFSNLPTVATDHALSTAATRFSAEPLPSDNDISRFFTEWIYATLLCSDLAITYCRCSWPQPGVAVAAVNRTGISL